MSVNAAIPEIEGLRENIALYEPLQKLRTALQATINRVQAGRAVLVAGRATVPSPAVGTLSRITATHVTVAGTIGTLSVPFASRRAGMSFVIVSSSALDTSSVDWVLVNE